MSRIRPRLSYANVIATLALVVAVGGTTAYAANQLGKNTVGPKQLKKNAVTTAKVKDGAITAAKVKSGDLTGAQINASTLGTVPTALHAISAERAAGADHAGSADKVDDLSVVKFDHTGVVSSLSPVTLFSLAGLRLEYSCETAAPDELSLMATTDVEGAGLWVGRTYPVGGTFEEFVPFKTGNGIRLYGSMGTGVYTAPGGRVVTFVYHESVGFCSRGVAGSAWGG